MEVILMFAGQLACEALNFALKRLIKEERPRGEYDRNHHVDETQSEYILTVPDI
jgi:dolichyldiphosphatase